MFKRGIYGLLFFLCFLLVFVTPENIIAQSSCPDNIGFEFGNIFPWKVNTGYIDTFGVLHFTGAIPLQSRETLIQHTYPQQLDKYGNFPITSPNGSANSFKLGNDKAGAKTDQISYTFTIPPDQKTFSLVYNYAVVFQDPPHQSWQQPKFTARVFDVSDDTYINCSSFSFTASSELPGFIATIDSVFYKPWTPVTIKLSGYEGKTIRLEFTVNDCTLGGHFGYAYIDVNDNCASPVLGSTYCKNDSALMLIAPYGFAGYRWFDKNFTTILGTNDTLIIKPPPLPNTEYAVEVTPYPQQGCTDTAYTIIKFSGDPPNLVLPEAPLTACITTGVDITRNELTYGSTPDLSFSYFDDPLQQQYEQTPKAIIQSGVYYIKATDTGGCSVIKPVTVKISTLPVFTVTDSILIYRPNSVNLHTAISGNTSGTVFSFWQDMSATVALLNPAMVNQSGTYYIEGVNDGLCSVTHTVIVIVTDPPMPPIVPPNVFSPNGDGIHDLWEIPVLNLYPGCVVEIFSRGGQSIFRSYGYIKPWDGKYNGKDLPVATYYYIIKPSPALAPVSGSITIIR